MATSYKALPMKPFAAAYLVPLLLTSLVTSSRARDANSRPQITVTETEQGFLFNEGDAKVMFYQRAPKSHEGKYERANYIHPLYDLDGNVLTEDFPQDHLHHRGIFWAWHQVWVGEHRIGDPWVAKDFSWDVVHAEIEHADSQSADLKVRVLWKSPLWTDEQGQQKPLVEETTVIRVHSASDDSRKIDFQISLQALEKGLRIGGSEDDKGYGGFSARVRLPENVRFTGKAGEVTPQRKSVDCGAWLDISARFGQTADVSGMTILCHPTVPGFPQPWILRQSRSMQNPVYPGREAIPLSLEKPLVLRYRLVLHRHKARPSTIEQWQAEYAKTAMPGKQPCRTF